MRDLAADLKIAEKNQAKLKTIIPRKLQIKEAKIAKKLAKSSESDIEKLKQIYKLTDDLTARLSPITSCKAGCGSCCNINVSVTEPEAEIIAQHTGRTLQSTNPIIKPNFHGLPCPFLNLNKCSIYSVRPYLCRRQLSIMPTEHWCHPDQSLDVEVPLIDFSELTKAFAGIAEKNTILDIRQWFK